VRAEHDLPRGGPEQADRETALSPVEERLLFLDRLHPGSPQYSIPVCYRFRGALDADPVVHKQRAVQAASVTTMSMAVQAM